MESWFWKDFAWCIRCNRLSPHLELPEGLLFEASNLEVRCSKESPDPLLAISEKFHLLCFCLRQVCSQILEEKNRLLGCASHLRSVSINRVYMPAMDMQPVFASYTDYRSFTGYTAPFADWNCIFKLYIYIINMYIPNIDYEHYLYIYIYIYYFPHWPL